MIMKGLNTAPSSIWPVITSVATKIQHAGKDVETEWSGKEANKCSIRDRPVFPGMRLSVHKCPVGSSHKSKFTPVVSQECSLADR